MSVNSEENTMADRGLGNYNSCCRLCLCEKPDSLKSVFDDVSGNPALVHKISAFVGVMVSSSCIVFA